jgi:exosome complex component RRP40
MPSPTKAASRKQGWPKFPIKAIALQSTIHLQPHHHFLSSNHNQKRTNIMETERIIVLPGETIDPSLIPSHKKQPLRLGPGLRHIPPSDIVPTVAGQLITNPVKNSMWIEYNSQRVCPSRTNPTSPPT